ncbi:MAG: hypothetical protein PHQ28_03410 [Mycobacterium sp.]|nr:hypothetical protein [Mycobacterium sp.]
MSTKTRGGLTDRQKYDLAARRQQDERHATQDPIPARITIALDLAGLWGPEVDRQLGGEEPMVDEWEAGLRVPTREQVEALARLTGQPIGFFYRRIEPGEYPTTTRICHRGRRKKATTVASHVDERGVMHVEIDPQPKLADVVPLPTRAQPAPAATKTPARRKDEPCMYGCAAPARLYPCGWRCDTHAPWAISGHPAPPSTPMPTRPVVEEQAEQRPAATPQRVARYNPRLRRHAWERPCEHHRECRWCHLHVVNHPAQHGPGWYQTWTTSTGATGTTQHSPVRIPDCPGPGA